MGDQVFKQIGLQSIENQIICMPIYDFYGNSGSQHNQKPENQSL